MRSQRLPQSAFSRFLEVVAYTTAHYETCAAHDPTSHRATTAATNAPRQMAAASHDEFVSLDIPLPPKVQLECSRFIAQLRRRQVPRSLDVARKTLEIMRLLVATSAARDVSALIAMIKQAGKLLVSAQPHELVIGNMVRRVLYIVREETTADESAGQRGGSSAAAAGRSLQRMLEAPQATDYSQQSAKDLKGPVLEVLKEVIEELSSVSSAIAEQAIEHIHSNEVILTHGRDPTVEAFLKAAHKKRSFEVVVCETAPAREGQQTAANLAEAGIAARSQRGVLARPPQPNDAGSSDGIGRREAALWTR